ncbi:MAG: SnoaL-like domain-containing protein [Oscillatoriales cyanobacterium RU_3_3]|nr:SnoaL-like domain-containing protein [Microcoleus sp. SU_5_3]NJL21190.1 SnoaL-like domain-containing protein [Leptolyngbyaceae cyanobacterium SM1_3_5]NJM61923.1 SnoaL-like domain-containing protein [Oscillatoriales cyanobacterium RU_3_3]
MDERIDILTTLYLAEQTFDSGDLERNLTTWSDEVLIETPFGSADSLEAYKQWFNQFYAQTSANGGTRHYVQNPIVQVNGDRAEIIAYLYIINASTGGFLGSARIHEKLKKTSDGWKFTYRSVVSDRTLSASAA